MTVDFLRPKLFELANKALDPHHPIRLALSLQVLTKNQDKNRWRSVPGQQISPREKPVAQFIQDSLSGEHLPLLIK